MAEKSNTQDFVAKAVAVHGNRYDYSAGEYVNSTTKFAVLCKEHGAFLVSPSAHLRGSGCPACWNEVRGARAKPPTKTTEQFVADARKVHGDRYDYSATEYTKALEKVVVTCPKHGEFSIRASSHLGGTGCQKCSKSTRIKSSKTFVIDAIAIHGDRYDYSKVSYLNSKANVEIVCKRHGPFFMSPNRHLASKAGCPKCWAETLSSLKKKSLQDFLESAKAVHGERYSYACATYISALDKLSITCHIHGSFEQVAATHLSGHGCPKCGNQASAAEDEIRNFILSLGVAVLERSRNIIPPLELDIVIPERRLAIEYCGLYWHQTSERRHRTYHAEKLALCEAAGYRLITIFEDEWLHKRAQVSNLLSAFVIRRNNRAVGARKCRLEAIDSSVVKPFYESNHLQGFSIASLHLGLFSGEELVAAGSFSKVRGFYGGARSDTDLELVRFCTKSGLQVHGALKRLCSEAFSKRPEAERILSFVDRRWFTGSSYVKAGFTEVSRTAPGYWYFLGKSRFSRFAYAKHRLPKLLENFDPSASEVQNMLNHGYGLIHDCGQIKFSLERERAPKGPS